MKRRTVLGGLGCTLAGLAGCVGSDDDLDDVQGYIRPDDDPQTVPPELRCEDGTFERRGGWIAEETLQWGDLRNENDEPIFALRVDTLSVERGEEVTMTLTNVSGEEQRTANFYQTNFDVYTEAGWQDPRGWTDGVPKPITDDLWSWEPDEQYEVTFEMTANGIIEGDYPPHESTLDTCPELPAGRYRFATAAPEEGDVGIAFDLIE